MNSLGALLEVAAPQRGLFLVAQAGEVGVGGAQLRRMASRDVLERRSQGVYRIPTFPIDEYTELMEAVLWANGRGRIAGESALALWDVADVNPRTIHLIVPPEYNPRRHGGRLYTVRRTRLDQTDRDEIHGIPTVTAAAAIRQATTAGVPGDLIEQAILRCHAREHIGVETAANLRSALALRGVTAGRR